MRSAENHKNEGNLDQAVCKCAEAFFILIKEYKENIEKDWDSNTINFRNEKNIEDAFLELIGHDEKLIKFTNFAQAYNRMSDAMTLISYGVDFRKYTKFKMLTPSILMSVSGQVR